MAKQKQPPLRIVQLAAANVKRLRAVEITPEGDVVRITGRNGQGKSSVLDAIMYALAGGRSHPERPIRDGEERAEVRLDLGELVVTRTWTPAGTYLKVASADGAVYTSGQAVLDKLVGQLAFDPLAFSRLPPKEQAATLRQVAQLDLTELDAERQRAFDERTAVNRELKGARARLESMPAVNAPAEEVSVAELARRLRQANEQLHVHDTLRRRLDEVRQAYDDAVARVAALERELANARERVETLLQAGTSLSEEVAGLEDPDVEQITAAIEDAEKANRQVRANERRAEAAAEVEQLATKAERLAKTIETCDKQRERLLAEAALPIEGLAFDEGGVTFGGVPFAQLSSAEQLRVSVAMGAAMSPRLRVMLIREGSLLDADSMRLLAQYAAEHDLQVWVERVSSGGEPGSVVIEDGAVAETAEADGSSARVPS